MYLDRCARVLEKLDEQKIEQMLITDPYAILYLTGKYIDPDERMYALYLNKNGNHKIFINSMFSVPEDLGVEKIRFDDTDDASAFLCRVVEKGKPLGVDKTFSAKYLLPVIKNSGASDYKLTSDCVDEVRAAKDTAERELMREASRINDLAMARFRNLIHEGVSEKEVEQQMLGIYRELGAEEYSFEPTVCFGSNTAEAHHDPDGTLIKEGDVVLLDVGCIKDGYCSDMTRVFFYKKVLKEEHRRIYDIVRHATESAEAICRPGIKIHEVDDMARGIIRDAGYGNYFNYRTGHFIGLEAHEAGDVSAINNSIAVPGNCFSIEPGIFIEGDIGVSIEDLVMITEDGAEILNHYSHDLDIIE